MLRATNYLVEVGVVACKKVSGFVLRIRADGPPRPDQIVLLVIRDQDTLVVTGRPERANNLPDERGGDVTMTHTKVSTSHEWDKDTIYEVLGIRRSVRIVNHSAEAVLLLRLIFVHRAIVHEHDLTLFTTHLAIEDIEWVAVLHVRRASRIVTKMEDTSVLLVFQQG